MKYLIILITICSLTSIIYGFTLEPTEKLIANKFIGAGTVGLFLVAMPLFLLRVSKGKKLKDYMLNEENIRKMRKKDSEKTDRR